MISKRAPNSKSKPLIKKDYFFRFQNQLKFLL